MVFFIEMVPEAECTVFVALSIIRCLWTSASTRLTAKLETIFFQIVLLLVPHPFPLTRSRYIQVGRRDFEKYCCNSGDKNAILWYQFGQTITWVFIRLGSLRTLLFLQKIIQTRNKEINKGTHYCPLRVQGPIVVLATYPCHWWNHHAFIFTLYSV